MESTGNYEAQAEAVSAAPESVTSATSEDFFSAVDSDDEDCYVVSDEWVRCQEDVNYSKESNSASSEEMKPTEYEAIQNSTDTATIGNENGENILQSEGSNSKVSTFTLFSLKFQHLNQGNRGEGRGLSAPPRGNNDDIEKCYFRSLYF